PQVARALDFMHSQQFVHRDIKPANILFDAHNNVYLADFGLAKGLAALGAEGGAGLTGTGMVLGTAGYMAPEQIMGQPADGRADQYAVAMTVYESLAGRCPFEGLPLPAILIRQTTERLPPLHEVVSAIPEAVSWPIQRALAKDPSGRFPTCLAFAQALASKLG